MKRHRPPSIGRQLSWALALLTLVGLAVVSAVIYSATAMRLQSAQEEALEGKTKVLAEFVRNASSGEAGLLEKLSMIGPMRDGTYLELVRADGTPIFRDASASTFRYSVEQRFQVSVGPNPRRRRARPSRRRHRPRRGAAAGPGRDAGR